MAEQAHKPGNSQRIRIHPIVRRMHQGSTSVEYAVVSLIVITVLFLPLPGLDESLVSTFVMALKQFQSNTTFLMSMP